MELKDVILSTLAEMDDVSMKNDSAIEDHRRKPVQPAVKTTVDREQNGISDEVQYLESVKERLLVLFEGFQSPNNVEIEAKIDLTLNFLEYLLSTIDTRLDTLKKRG